MKTTKILAILVLTLGLILSQAEVSEAVEMGSAFTYQGRLIDDGEPANGIYDFQFILFETPTGWFPIGIELYFQELEVVDGYFTVLLDFNDVELFNGDERWLGVGIRPGEQSDPNRYTLLEPRQKLTPTPYALQTRGIFVDKDKNVGVGTTDPSADFHVYDPNGHVYVVGESDNGYAFFIADGTFNSGLKIKENGTTKAHFYWNTSQKCLSLADASTDRLAVKAGNVGIGTTNPTAHLYVSKPYGSPDPVLKLATKISNIPIPIWNYLTFDAASINATGTLGGASIYLNNTSSGNVYIAAGGGNVGIGTTDPQSMLDVAGWTRTEVLQITGGFDVAEPFEISPTDSIEPGMVVCIDTENPGRLVVSSKAYDRSVAGIISGAGGIKPAMLMGHNACNTDGSNLVALTGRVYCHADASNAPINPGDLLTTSDMPGRAMKVTDYTKAQGAIIGKAMSSLEQGQGLVLVLVALQ